MLFEVNVLYFFFQKRKDVICFAIDKQQKSQIREIAKREKRSISQTVQLIIDDYLVTKAV